MGRIGGWFKKSDDKEKSTSNPYAQQPPVTQQQSVGQHSPPPGYDQYNQYNGNQYNANQNLPQAHQGQPFGLPSGPRPGGLPGRVAPEPSRTSTFDSNMTALHDPNSPPPSYYNSPNTSTGRSPALSSNQTSPSFAPGGGSPAFSSTSSPSLGSGYPKEKYGASDGVGRNRFDSPVTPRYNASPSLPSQRQGGYGNLDTGRDELFSGYNGPPKPTTSSRFGQSGAPNSASMLDGDAQPMSEEERQQAEVEGIKTQIEEEWVAANASGQRSLAGLRDGTARLRAMNDMLLANSEVLARTEENADKTRCHADVGNVHLDELDAANKSMFNLVANSKAKVAYRAEKRMVLQHQHQMNQAQLRQEEGDIHHRLDAEMRAIEASKPKGLLGASKAAADSNRWEFEDDTGFQRGQREENDELLANIYAESQEMNKQARAAGFLLADQNRQIDRLTGKVQAAGDRVTKNQIRLDTKYNKK